MAFQTVVDPLRIRYGRPALLGTYSALSIMPLDGRRWHGFSRVLMDVGAHAFTVVAVHLQAERSLQSP